MSGVHHGKTLSIAVVGDDVEMTLTPVTERADGTQPEALVLVYADNAMGHLVSIEGRKAGGSGGAPTMSYTVDFVAPMPPTGSVLRIDRRIAAQASGNALASGLVVDADGTLIASASGWFTVGGRGGVRSPISLTQTDDTQELGDLPPVDNPLVHSPVARTLGLVVTEASTDRLAFQVTNVTTLLNGNGGLHGGVSAFAMTLAAESMASTSDAVARPMHVDLQYWRPLGTDHRPVSITVDMVRRGKTTATATAVGYTTDGRPGVQATIVLSARP